MQSPDVFDRPDSVFYDGAWQRPATEQIIEVTDPATGQRLGCIAAGGAADVHAAALAATRAFVGWSQTPSAVRAKYLRAIGSALQQRGEQLIMIMMRNGGKPRFEAEVGLGDAIATFSYYAGLADGFDSQQDNLVHHLGGHHVGSVRHDAIGPVSLIVPWNFPLVTSAWKIAPALAAGCTVVLKTSEITPYLELIYAKIAQEIGLPPGVFNLVTGTTEVGAALAANPLFRKVSFTGSNAVGAKVMHAVADRCLPIALELGGKSPIIVTADCDLDLAVDCIAAGVFYNAGQMCSATSRLIVERSIEPQLVEALKARADRIRVGSPFDAGIDMGPITHRAQLRRVAAFLSGAEYDGLKCVSGGHIATDQEGFFVPPTIYREVPAENTIWTHEIFGPVLATTTFGSDEEAVQKANASDYALAASVVSGDAQRAKSIINQISAGQIWYNTPQIVYPGSAWGGFKASGVGRELGPWGLASFLGVKHVTSPIGKAAGQYGRVQQDYIQ